VDGLLSPATALGGQIGFPDHPFQGRRQRLRIARLAQQPAAGVFDHFWKGTVGGQDDGHAVGPGLQDGQSLAFPVNRWHAHVLFVGAQRRVQRHQRHVLTGRPKRGGQRITVQTTPAVHSAGTGCQMLDLHER